jgi:AcrR family transcriptional regulator
MSSRTKARARRGVGRPGDGEDVREAILAATLRQLESTGSPGQVTIAAIVEEAGCTPPSLYHYWPRRELLMQEASTRGWAHFRDSQTGAADHHDPVERLRQRGRAYLDFALARPSLFRVLFLDPPASATAPNATQDVQGTQLPQPGQPTRPGRPTRRAAEQGAAEQGAAEQGAALDDLVGDVSAAMATGGLRPADPLTIALALWSAMHGVAALWAVTPDLPADLAHVVGDLAQEAVLRGLAA